MAKEAPRKTPVPMEPPGVAPALETFTTIEITKDYLHFSAAHFTIFSATERENAISWN
jgi:hypothetical protein